MNLDQNVSPSSSYVDTHCHWFKHALSNYALNYYSNRNSYRVLSGVSKRILGSDKQNILKVGFNSKQLANGKAEVKAWITTNGLWKASDSLDYF